MSKESFKNILYCFLDRIQTFDLSLAINDYSALLNQMFDEKTQRIAELEKQLANSIRPKFDRQEHIYSFSFGKIKEFVVVAYLDNNITLCEDVTTNKLEWCDNDYLVLTKQEAELKLKELQE